MEFRYAISDIERILTGNVRKFNSIEEIPTIKRKGNQLKFMGIYQEDKVNNQLKDITSSLLREYQKYERAHQSLICIAYDPTIINEKITKEILGNHSSYRLKIEDYSQLPDFSEKKGTKQCVNIALQIGDNIGKNQKIISQTFLAEKILELLKNDLINYGLTRFEALYFEIFRSTLRNIKKTTR